MASETISALGARVDALGERAKARRRAQRQAETEQTAARLEARERTKAELRASMPKTAALVDRFRAVFGDDTKLLAAKENGRVVINRPAMMRAGLDVRAYENNDE